MEILMIVPILAMIGLGIFLISQIKDLRKSDELALLNFCYLVGPAAIVTGFLLIVFVL